MSKRYLGKFRSKGIALNSSSLPIISFLLFTFVLTASISKNLTSIFSLNAYGSFVSHKFLYLYKSSSGDLRLQKCQPPFSIILFNLYLSILQNGLFLNFNSRNHCGDFKNFFIHNLLPYQNGLDLLKRLNL